MTAPTRDDEFTTFAENERALLQRCAFLLTGHRRAADDLVDATLAELYGRWSRTRSPRRDAVTLLYRTDPDRLRLPWAPRARFELLDGAPRPEPSAPIVADLVALTPQQRLTLVCERVAALPSVEIATVLGTGVQEVLSLSQAARAALVARRDERADDEVLTAELAAAVPPDLRPTGVGDDAAHGRWLRRRRARRALAAAGAFVVVVLGLSQLRPSTPRRAAPRPPP